jgi:hypothetical protein
MKNYSYHGMKVNLFFIFFAQLILIISPGIIFSQTQHFTIQEVKFKSEGTILAGSMLIPSKPYAAVVLVHGSDPVKREMDFAQQLATEGIAVLTYDKRGVGASGGVYVGPSVGTNNLEPANLYLLADDANAAVNTFRSFLKNKNLQIGLVGFSQAGWIIPMAAQRSKEIKFMVIFSGPVVTTLEQLRFQFYTNGDQHFWDKHTESDVRKHVKNDPDRYHFIATDPQEQLRELTIPGLWIFGGRDIQVPVGLSIENLDKQKATGKNYEYILFPELGHKTASTELTETFGRVIQWIKKRSRL